MPPPRSDLHRGINSPRQGLRTWSRRVFAKGNPGATVLNAPFFFVHFICKFGSGPHQKELCEAGNASAGKCRRQEIAENV